MDYSQILTKKYKGSEWVLNGNNYEGLNWLSDSPKPTKEKLESYWDEVQNEIQIEQLAKKELRQSAINKLTALGLNEEEVKAIIGA
jgi:hypothetical protein